MSILKDILEEYNKMIAEEEEAMSKKGKFYMFRIKATDKQGELHVQYVREFSDSPEELHYIRTKWEEHYKKYGYTDIEITHREE
jgi:hypothetical protein